MMLNRDRKEVIDAIIEYFSTKKNIYDCYDTMDLTDAINFNGELYSKEFEIWMNSEYVEPFKITQAEKCILENVQQEFNWVYRVSEYNELMLSVKKPSFYLNKEIHAFGKYQDFRCFNRLFQFVTFENSPLKISDILENCEVIDDAK